jgi:high-affinity iron transporter
MLLRLLVCLFITTTAFAEPANRSPRFVVNLLDYVAADYGGAVVDGKIASQAEYDEQLEFLDAALESLQNMPETKTETQLLEKVSQLKTQVVLKASSAEIAKRAQEAKLDVIRIAKVELAPNTWPDIKNGQALYAQRCTACHGEKGFGDGPGGKGLEPAPANFHGEGMAASSAFKSFNVIRVGVPGTGMAAFNDLSDKEVWDLAFFVNALRFENKNPSNDPSVLTAATLEQVATKTDSELLAVLPGSDEQKQKSLAALRSHAVGNQVGNSLATATSQLKKSQSEYLEGKYDDAKTSALTAYLEGIEPVEPALKSKDSAFVSELEVKMAAVRSAIEQKASADEMKFAVNNALAAVEEADRLLTSKTESSPTLTLTLAAGILLREGFEAVLILIALLAVIRAAGDARAARWVHGGWIAAVAVGVIAWFFSGWLMNMSGIGREALEGNISLLAVLVLLYVGFWLHRRTEIQRWKQFIEGHVKQLIAGNNVLGLALISFMAVFREAFETVLFLRAIWMDAGEAGRSAMWLGVFIAFGLVLLLAWALLKWSAKLPIRKVFTVSSVLIIALAVILAGKGIHAFQETGMVSLTSVGHFSFDILGLYSTKETLLAQFVTLVIAVIAWVIGNKPSQAVAARA